MTDILRVQEVRFFVSSLENCVVFLCVWCCGLRGFFASPGKQQAQTAHTSARDLCFNLEVSPQLYLFIQQ
jgi:hypothetical protein